VDLETVSATGAATRRWFDPFGDQITTSAAWSADRSFLNKSASSFTSLTQVGARILDTTLGRFLSVDPVFNSNDPRPDNGYAYSDNDPITFSDRSGLCLMAGGVLNTQTHCAGGTGSNKHAGGVTAGGTVAAPAASSTMHHAAAPGSGWSSTRNLPTRGGLAFGTGDGPRARPAPVVTLSHPAIIELTADTFNEPDGSAGGWGSLGEGGGLGDGEGDYGTATKEDFLKA
jgi:RHS repeat-associated protein